MASIMFACMVSVLTLMHCASAPWRTRALRLITGSLKRSNSGVALSDTQEPQQSVLRQMGFSESLEAALIRVLSKPQGIIDR